MFFTNKTAHTDQPDAVDSVWSVLREQDEQDARYAALAAEAEARMAREYPHNGYAVSDSDTCAGCGERIVEWEHEGGYRVWTHHGHREVLSGPDFSRRECA